MKAVVATAAALVVGLALLGSTSSPAPAQARDCSVRGDLSGVIGGRLSLAQVEVARKVAGVARGAGIGRRGLTIALQTAMQESTLDPKATAGFAVGVFQQIAPGPSRAYASYDRTDPAASAKGFFTVLVQRVPGYADDPRPNHELAQVVQASGAGASHYARWQPLAEQLAASFFDDAPGVQCVIAEAKGPHRVLANGTTVALPPESGLSGSVVAHSPAAAKALSVALSWLGTPYAWGGGAGGGPTRGIRDGGVADSYGDYDKVGFDCSGLVLHAYYQAGIPLPRVASAQRAGAGPVLPWSDALPGDLLFWGTGSIGAIHHVAIYLGVVDGVPKMIEAPQSGGVVRVSSVRTGGDFRPEAVRPGRVGGDTDA